MILKVKGYRNMLNLSQKEVGDMLGLSKQSFSLKERGKVKFTIDEMKTLKNLFSSINPHITIEDIFFWTNVTQSYQSLISLSIYK